MRSHIILILLAFIVIYHGCTTRNNDKDIAQKNTSTSELSKNNNDFVIIFKNFFKKYQVSSEINSIETLDLEDSIIYSNKNGQLNTGKNALLMVNTEAKIKLFNGLILLINYENVIYNGKVVKCNSINIKQDGNIEFN